MDFNSFLGQLIGQAESSLRTKSGKQIHAMAPSRIPVSVLNGCKEELVVIPGTDHPAKTREGKQIVSKSKGGRPYLVMDQAGIPRKRWKKLVADEKRRAAKRFVGTFDFPSKAVA